MTTATLVVILVGHRSWWRIWRLQGMCRGGRCRMIPEESPAWREALAQVPGAGSAQGVVVAPLAGGTTNATFRVATGEGVFVLRLHEPYGADLGVDHGREAVLQAAAGRRGPRQPGDRRRSPPVATWSASSWTEHRGRWRSWRTPRGCGSWRRTLEQLHGSAGTHGAATGPAGASGASRRRDRGAGSPWPGGRWHRAWSRARATLARQADRRAYPVHPARRSGAFEPDRTRPLRLVDWEYAAVGDPLADPACLLAYYPQLLPLVGRSCWRAVAWVAP